MGTEGHDFSAAAVSLVSPAQSYYPLDPADPVGDNSLVLRSAKHWSTFTLNSFLNMDPLNWLFLSGRQKDRLASMPESTRTFLLNKWASYMIKLEVDPNTHAPNVCNLLNDVNVFDSILKNTSFASDTLSYISINICGITATSITTTDKLPYQIFIGRAFDKCIVNLQNSIKKGFNIIGIDNAWHLICASMVLLSHIAILKTNSLCSKFLKELIIISGPGGFLSWKWTDFEAPLYRLYEKVMNSTATKNVRKAQINQANAGNYTNANVAKALASLELKPTDPLADAYLVVFTKKVYEAFKSMLL